MEDCSRQRCCPACSCGSLLSAMFPRQSGRPSRMPLATIALVMLSVVLMSLPVSAVEPETCYSRQHQSARVNARLALNRPGTQMVTRMVRSERDCVLTCCSEDVQPGAKCNMVIFNGSKHDEDKRDGNCMLFHCQSEQDCPLMKAQDGINTYDIYKGLIHPTTVRPLTTTATKDTTTTMTTLPPMTPTTTTETSTTTQGTTTTMMPATTTTTTMTTEPTTTTTPPPTTTEAPETTTEAPATTTEAPATTTTPPPIFIIATMPAIPPSPTPTTTTTTPTTETPITTTTTIIPTKKINKTSRKQNKSTKKGKTHPVTTTTQAPPTSTTTTLPPVALQQQEVMSGEEDEQRTTNKLEPETETTPTSTVSKTTAITPTITTSTTAPTTTTTTTMTTTMSTTTVTEPSTARTTPAVSLVIVPKDAAQNSNVAQGKVSAARGTLKSGMVAFMVLGLTMLTLALAVGGRKAMESFDRRHYTRLELNDLHYEV